MIDEDGTSNNMGRAVARDERRHGMSGGLVRG